MEATPDAVCAEYAEKKVQLTIRRLEPDAIVIEGNADGLEFLGKLLLAQAKFQKDCGFQLSNSGAGKALLTDASTEGLYIHCLPPGAVR